VFTPKDAAFSPESADKQQQTTEGVLQRRIVAIEKIQGVGASDDALSLPPTVTRTPPALDESTPSSSSRSQPPSHSTSHQPSSRPTSPRPQLVNAAEASAVVASLDSTISSLSRNITSLRSAKNRIQRSSPPDLTFSDGDIEDYIESLYRAGRLQLLNHTQLWQHDADKTNKQTDVSSSYSSSTSTSSSYTWLLRQSLSSNQSLGSRLGMQIEAAVYKAICHVVIDNVGTGISAMHGLGVLGYGDVRIFGINTTNVVMDSAAQPLLHARRAISTTNADPKKYLQQSAITETILSRVQTSAPMLKFFPIPLQRALVSNAVMLAVSLVSDLVQGVRVRVLGHELTLNFSAVDGISLLSALNDMDGEDKRRESAEFEKAVATLTDRISPSLNLPISYLPFYGVIKHQIANVVARIVVTLIDDVVGGIKVDLWGGVRVLAGVEYRDDGGSYA
jgi:hypothetical protein